MKTKKTKTNKEKIMIPKHTIIQYIRYNNGDPRGVLVAVKFENNFRIGYSLCNKKDRFSKDMALKIALGRAYTGNPNCVIPLGTPHPINKALGEFASRCKKYYKVA